MTSESKPHGQPRWDRPRWYELVPEALLAASLLFFLIDEPDAATSAFKSGRAVGLMAAAAALWIGGRVVLARFLHARLARTALFALAALAALAVVVLPAYRNETVVEAFPLSPTPATAASVTARSSPSPPPTTLPSPTTPAAASEAPTAPSGTTPPSSVPTTTIAPVEPVLLRSAPFTGVDHRASGTVSIYRAPDGRHVIGLESFDIQPGPDYDVYVVPGADRIDLDGGARLDDLRGNQGTQFYDVPADIAVASGEWTVLIWCQTFGVPVANATPV